MKNTSKIIRRADLTKNFSIIPNHIAQSKELSPNAKSLIIHILSMPDNWYYVKTQFWRKTNLGRAAFNKAWKELEEVGFIKSERIYEGNLVRGYNYIISDLPIFGLTEDCTNRSVDNQKVVDNKRNIDKDIDTKKDLQKDFDHESTGGVDMGKSFLESFQVKYGRLPSQQELLNYLNK